MAIVDPVCKREITMVVDTIKYKGKTYEFCSRGCAQEFQKNPEKYLTAKKK
ncbi:MAG: YHS domain-containing protein [Dehalococcoidales bacterium]|nr:YHS domain-containing protein [Dehalococcoidales bacterium]